MAKELIQGFIVGIRTRRQDNVPSLQHIDREVFISLDNVVEKDSHDEFILTTTHLLPDQTYTFYVCCLFAEGRGATAKSKKVQTPALNDIDMYLWTPLRMKVDKYVYSNVFEMSKIEGIHHYYDDVDMEKEEEEVFEKQRETSINLAQSTVNPVAPSMNASAFDTQVAKSTPLSKSELKELEECDMILNTQKREYVK